MAKTAVKTKLAKARVSRTESRGRSPIKGNGAAKLSKAAARIAETAPAVSASPASAAETVSGPTPPPSKLPKTHTKQAIVIGLLQRKEGVALAALTETTGWLPHTARAMLTGLRKKGYAIDRTRGEDKVTRYRIVGMPERPASREQAAA